MANNQTSTVSTSTTTVAHTETSNLIYRVAKAGDEFQNFGQNDLFSQVLEEEVLYPDGSGKDTVKRYPNVYIDFVSSDGQTPRFAQMYRRFTRTHKAAQTYFESKARAEFAKGAGSRFQPGSVLIAQKADQDGVMHSLGARGETILYASTRLMADAPHNPEMIEKALKRIHGWVIAQPEPEKLLIAVAGINTAATKWEDVGHLFGDTLGTLPCKVIITIGSEGTEFYADGTTVSHAAPKAEAEAEKQQTTAEAEAEEENPFIGDPFLPEGDELDLI